MKDLRWGGFALSILLLAGSLLPVAYAADVTVTGANGVTGASATAPGADGEAGEDGETANATANAADIQNTATATGGRGGRGGSGADGADDPINMTPTDGGDTGLAGSGGAANAIATNSNLAIADAQGGAGGYASRGGGQGQYGGADGAYSDGGTGGDALAQAIVDIGAIVANFGTSATAEGGYGGTRSGSYNPVGLTAGDGGDAIAYSYARGSGNYQYVGEQARARGGSGGQACCSYTFDVGGNGGDATSDSTIISLGNANIWSNQSQAFGGHGGDGLLAGGLGGVATATAWVESATGKGATASATQEQGNHGDILGGSVSSVGVDGIDSFMINQVGGSTTGTLALGQASLAGDGQNNRYGIAGNGGNASSELTLTDTQASRLSIWGGSFRADAGKGGASENQAGNGGDASLMIDVTGKGDVQVSNGSVFNVRAFGGEGGDAGDNDAGVGGDATMDIRAESTTGGKVEIAASAFGGKGGTINGAGQGADGRDVYLNNNMQGFTTGELLLSQHAGGGEGSKMYGTGKAGNGGEATSILNRSGSFTNLELTASATGGYGGTGGDRTGIRGGDATAQATAINNAGSAVANADALAGANCVSGCYSGTLSTSQATALADTRNGGTDATAYAEGITANATARTDTGSATATGEGHNLNVQALSTSGDATAIGGNGSNGSTGSSAILAQSVSGNAFARGTGNDMHVTARSQTGEAKAYSFQNPYLNTPRETGTATAETFGRANRANARLSTLDGEMSATAKNAGYRQIRASAAMSSSYPNPGVTEAIVGGEIKDRDTDRAERLATDGSQAFFAQVIADPNGSSLQALLQGNTESLGKINPYEALAAGRLEGLAYLGTHTTLFESSVDMQFEVGAGEHDVSFALFNAYGESGGFDTLDFSLLIEGDLLFDESFTDLAAALTFFDDNASIFSGIMVGVDGLLDIQMNFDIAISAGTGDLFTTDYAFSSTSSVVPIPAAVWLFGSALAGLGWMRRRTSRAGL